jgi:CBS domain containing-hemolysin-like protein
MLELKMDELASEAVSSIYGVSSMELLVLALLFLASAFFSSSETALLSVNRFKIEKLAKEGNKSAKIVLKLLEEPQKLITTILIGNNLVNIAAASISTSIAIKLFGSLGVGIATGVVTLLTLVFGEVLPKNFAIKKADTLALIFSRIIYILEKIFYPFTMLLIKLTNVLFSKWNNEEKRLTEEEIKLILEHGAKEGAIDNEEKELIRNILEFDKTTVEEIMTPRTKIVAINEEEPLSKVLEIMKESSFSKLPVYGKDIDDIKGVVYLKDVLKNLNRRSIKVKDIIREVLFVPETKNVADLFKEMKNKKIKMVIVVDEYGSVAGLVTLEDILECLVGEISENEEEIIKTDKNTYIVKGNVNIINLERELKINISDEGYNTVAGLIMHYLQKIPKKGDKVVVNNLEFEVLDVKDKVIKKVKIKFLNS